jgi:hypothetical protein
MLLIIELNIISTLNFSTAKMRQYDVEPCNIYNMDEKGFLMGIISCSKRIFSK